MRSARASAPARLQIELFGDPCFTFDGAPWRFTAPPKTLPLLALLALREEPIARGTLATLLWPDDADTDARANLRRHLHALAKALPPGYTWFTSSGALLQWNHDAPARIDAVEFLRLSEEPSTQSQAARLYRGDLLSGSFDEAIIAERDRLRNIHLQSLYELAQQAKSARDFNAAGAYAEQILGIDEWREDAVRLYMTARYATGDRSGALAAFERFARRLREELHTDPMFETIALRDAVLNDTLPQEENQETRSSAQARPLVGRDDLLAQLQLLWRKAADGAGTAVFVAGEAGIGKSRLTQELLTRIEMQGGRSALGRTSDPEALPYQPIIEALRQLVPFMRVEPRDTRWLRTLAPLVPELRRLTLSLDDAPALDADRAQLRLQDAMLRAVEAAARVRPVAILLEDLHFAKADTLEAIGGLAERLSAIPALLILTYRNTEADADSPLRALRRRLQRSSRAAHLTVPRLAASDVAAVVELLHNRAGERLAQRVFAMSEGNPLFMWQLLHGLAEHSGELDMDSAIASVGDAVRRRLALLTPEVRAAADVAATIGDTFSVEEIGAVGGWDESAVYDAIATLLDRQLISERAGDAFEYGFTHALIGSAIYEATSQTARAIRHRRSAEVLQRTRVSQGRGHALVAKHWERAGEPARVRRAYLDGARAALQSYARQDARELAQRVLDAGASGAERFGALQLLIASTDRAGDVETAAHAVDELDEIADTLGAQQQYEAFVTRIRFHEHHSQRDAQSRAIERLGLFSAEHENEQWAIEATIRRGALVMQRGNTAQGEEILRSLGDPERITDPKQRYRYYAQLAQSLIRQGRYDEGKTQMRAFRRYLETHPSIEGESLYAYAEHKYSWMLEDANYIKKTATRIIDLAQARGDLLDEANGRIDLAYVKHQLHDTSSARLEFERALELFALCKAWQGWVNTRINYGVIEREIGHLDRAIAYWKEGREKAIEIGVKLAVIVADTNVAEVALLAGDVETALASAQAAYDRNEKSGEIRLRSETEVTLGAALCRSGDTRRGFALLESGLVHSRAMSQARTLAGHLTAYLDELMRAGKRVAAHVIAHELLELFERDPHDHQHPGRICWSLSRYLRATGRDAQADALLERAREILDARLEAFDEEADRTAFRSMFPNAEIYEHTASRLAR